MQPFLRFRNDWLGAEETFQVLPSLLIVLVCVGIVLAAIHDQSASATEALERDRGDLQAAIFVDALRHDDAVSDGGVAVWSKAEAIANRGSNLTFAPSHARYASLSVAGNGSDLVLLGSAGERSATWAFASAAVAVKLPGGAIVPGMFRVGVEIR